MASSSSPDMTSPRFNSWPYPHDSDEAREKLKSYTGNCQCGRFSYSFKHPNFDVPEEGAELPPMRINECTCTICAKRGYLLIYTHPDLFQIKDTESNDGSPSSQLPDTIGEWRVNNEGAATHFFCQDCGVPMGIYVKSSVTFVAINARTVNTRQWREGWLEESGSKTRGGVQGFNVRQSFC